MAWYFRSRPCLAEPPAESPSTKNNSFFFAFFDCAGVSFPERFRSFRLFRLPPRARFLAFRAASRASRALIDFRINIWAKSPFSINA